MPYGVLAKPKQRWCHHEIRIRRYKFKQVPIEFRVSISFLLLMLVLRTFDLPLGLISALFWPQAAPANF